MKDTKGDELFQKNRYLAVFVLEPIMVKLPSWFVGIHYDDLNQVALLGLWNASVKFDDSKGLAFSTFAVPIIRRKIARYIHSWSRHKNVSREIKLVSIEEPITEDLTIADTLEYTPPEDVSWIFTDTRLDERRKLVIKLKLEGYSLSEIGKKMGFSKQRADELFKSAAEILRKE
jgi:RNA polymerase sigma factor (sigma-70 family)